MPVVLPAPTELAQLPWHARDRAILTARALLRTYSGIAEPSEPRRWHATAEEVQRRKTQASIRAAEWGEAVRDEARRLERAAYRAPVELPPDPDAAAHRAALMDNVA